MSLVERSLIVNLVLMSSMWYFIVVWVGSKKVMRQIKACCNYLWSGFEHTTIARVNWDDCTMPKEVGGLSLTSLEDAMKAVMSK